MWNIEEITGYKPITTLWQDFTVAEQFGKEAVKDTFEMAMKNSGDYKYLTELVMVVNWKSWQYADTDEDLSKLYVDLYYEADNYAIENLKDDELTYFYRTTD